MKFLKTLLKESLYFLVLLIVLALFMHKGDLPRRFDIALDDPSKFGHAFIYAALIFLIVFIFRVIFRVIFMKIREKKSP